MTGGMSGGDAVHDDTVYGDGSRLRMIMQASEDLLKETDSRIGGGGRMVQLGGGSGNGVGGSGPEWVNDHLDWVELMEGDVRNILSMPDKAQREVSKSVSLCAENRFVQRVRNPHLGGSEQRHRNWLAERGHQ